MAINFSDWFVCSHCGTTDMSVKQVLGMGNYSLNFECPCGFRHVERDASSDNWNRKISILQMIQRRGTPEVSNKVSKMAQCPYCESEEVEVWLFSDNPGKQSGETIGHTRLDCKQCPEVLTKEISHS